MKSEADSVENWHKSIIQYNKICEIRSSFNSNIYFCICLGAMSEPGDQVTVGGRSMLDNMVGVGDMVLLESLTEDSVIENLWDRYNNKDIYVSFKWIPPVEPTNLLVNWKSNYVEKCCFELTLLSVVLDY